jgi:6-phosphofructo-2-kinase/fructose-2,6-biphosphatase 4
MAAQLYKTTTGRMFHAGEIAIVTVGLPARGKTYLAHKLARYLRWLGVPTAIFSVGDYRRRLIGTQVPHDFFTDPNTLEQRIEVADKALMDLIQWLQHGGQVGIYDASNTEAARRKVIYDRLKQAGIQPLFIESICDKEDIIDANIRELKHSSPDYRGVDADRMVEDFLKRIEGYKVTYERMLPDHGIPFIQDMNVGERLIVHHVKGYLQSRIVFYLMSAFLSNKHVINTMSLCLSL